MDFNKMEEMVVEGFNEYTVEYDGMTPVPYKEQGYVWIVKGSNPIDDPTNQEDDWTTGSDAPVESIEEAEEEMKECVSFYPSDWGAIIHTNGTLVRLVPPLKETEDDDDDWKREGAMQAGMAFGCDGYNDYYGY